jgi:hypothetical protein
MCGHTETQTSADRHWYPIGDTCQVACLMVTNYPNTYTEAQCVPMATPAAECKPPTDGASWDGTTCWNGMVADCAQGDAYRASPCPPATHCLRLPPGDSHA